ncbi:hypothetical protein BDR07DRAFT_1376903 [Suillus spraguei]|nr:hypothetical protein BDR07DRAFT_1376903 [Suillus spraguei]
MAKGKGNSSRNSTQEVEAAAPGSSHRPRSTVRRFLKKVKDGAKKLKLTSALQNAQRATEHMRLLSSPAMTVMSGAQNAQADLDAAGTFQDTYLKPLRIFDNVIEKIADVHPYAKMALGVLSCAAKSKPIATTRYSNFSTRYLKFTLS